MPPTAQPEPRRRLSKWWKGLVVGGWLSIGIIALVVTPSICGNGPNCSRTEKAWQDLRGLSIGLDLFKAQHGRYPTTEEGLKALTLSGDPSVPSVNGHAVLKRLPSDPWGNPYHYQSPGEHHPEAFDLSTYGSDGTPGGTGPATDLSNWPVSIDTAARQWQREQLYSGAALNETACFAIISMLLGLPLYLFGVFTSFRHQRNWAQCWQGFHLHAYGWMIGLVSLIPIAWQIIAVEWIYNN